MMMEAIHGAVIDGVENIERFVFGGDATFTVVSNRTGTRYTFKVEVGMARDEKPAPYFARLLAGPDNVGDFVYLGTIFPNARTELRLTRASKLTDDSGPVKALRFVLAAVAARRVDAFQFWHEGRCCRCGRPLTVPESIATGVGPKCAELLAA